MTVFQRVEEVTPLEKFIVLARELDSLRYRFDQYSKDQSIDDLLEVVEIESLALRFGVSSITMQRRLREVGGKVFKIGKKHVIRKIALLEVYEALECVTK